MTTEERIAALAALQARRVRAAGSDIATTHEREQLTRTLIGLLDHLRYQIIHEGQHGHQEHSLLN